MFSWKRVQLFIIIIDNIMCIARENLVNNERVLKLNDQQQHQPQQQQQSLQPHYQHQHQMQSHNNWFQSVRKVSKNINLAIYTHRSINYLFYPLTIFFLFQY